MIANGPDIKNKFVHHEIETEKEMSKDEMMDRITELFIELREGRDTPASLSELEQLTTKLLSILKKQ